MNKTLLTISLSISTFSFAQNYAIDQIPANLLTDAYAVIRQNDEKIELLKIDELKYTEDVVVTVLSKAGDNYVDAQTDYNPNTRIDLFEATLYDANGKEIKKFKTKDFGDQSYVTGGLAAVHKLICHHHHNAIICQCHIHRISRILNISLIFCHKTSI